VNKSRAKIKSFIIFSKTKARKSLGPYTHHFLQMNRELLFNTGEDLIDCMTCATRLIVITITTLSLFLPTISTLDRITSFQIHKEDVQILYPLNVAYVFAAGEGQLRCTDGKLASSQDQCPATDRCPPSENNTISNCVSEVSSNSTLQSSDIQNTTSNETTAPPSCLENRFTVHTPQCADSSSTSEDDASTS